MSLIAAAQDFARMRFGTRRFWIEQKRRYLELYLGDICHVGADLLVVSAFQGDLEPYPGTVIAALKDTLSVELDSRLLHQVAADVGYMDVDHGPFRRVAVLSLKREEEDSLSRSQLEQSLMSLRDNFRQIFEMGWRSVAMPLLGTGDQHIPSEAIIPLLCLVFPEIVRQVQSLDTVRIVAYKPESMLVLAQTVDDYIDRSPLGCSQMMDAVLERLQQTRKDVPGELLEEFNQVAAIATARSSALSIGAAARVFGEKACLLLCAHYQVLPPEDTSTDPAMIKRRNNEARLKNLLGPLGTSPTGVYSYLRLMQGIGNQCLHPGLSSKDIAEDEAISCLHAVCRVVWFFTQLAKRA